jgi:DNA-binding PadR family transcriptional regulator
MKRLARDPATLLPLKQATYQILLALDDGELLHGYAIMQAISAMTAGRESILPGTLYAALARMVDEGLVEESAPNAAGAPTTRTLRRAVADDDPSGGPARRYYRRTKFGRAVARAESERLRALLAVARAQNMFGEGE